MDSTNLVRHGIQSKVDGEVIVGGSDVAPYAVYTNEPWISDRWHGKKNPNEGWLDRSIERAIPGIRNIFSGVYSAEEIIAMNSEEEKTSEARVLERLNAIRKEEP